MDHYVPMDYSNFIAFLLLSGGNNKNKSVILGVMFAMADSISLEHKQDNISQIKVIWDDSFP